MTTVATAALPTPPSGTSSPVLDVAVPVYNEVAELEASVRTLRSYLDAHLPFTARVTIADNASTDGTWEVATRLAAQLPGVRAVHLDQKGRGRALRAVWSASDAEVVAYMDVDLATGLDALLPLVAPLLSGHSDVAIGSRLAPGARVRRGVKRELISRSYNLLLHAALQARFSDAQCGFKAVRADVARALLPLVEDEAWFFDTELLAVAEHNGLRIHEVPVDWTDDPDSRVDVASTATADLRGTWRLWRRFAAGGARTASPLARRRIPGGSAAFAGVGGLSTLAYVALFLGLAPSLGVLAANAVSLSACAAANWGTHRVLDSSEPEPAAAAVGLWGAGLVLSSTVLGLTRLVTTSLPIAVAVILATGAVVSAARVVARRGAAYRAHLDESCGPRPPR